MRRASSKRSARNALAASLMRCSWSPALLARLPGQLLAVLGREVDVDLAAGSRLGPHRPFVGTLDLRPRPTRRRWARRPGPCRPGTVGRPCATRPTPCPGGASAPRRRHGARRRPTPWDPVARRRGRAWASPAGCRRCDAAGRPTPWPPDPAWVRTSWPPVPVTSWDPACRADRLDPWGHRASGRRGSGHRHLRLGARHSDGCSQPCPERTQTRKSPQPELGALHVRNRRRPTLPGRLHPSTIGAGGLNFRVRNGNGCLSAAITTETSALQRTLWALENSTASTNIFVLNQALGRLVPVG